VELRKSDFNTLLADVGRGDLDFFYMYWEGTDPNAEIFMVQFRSTLLPESGGYNFGRYSNPMADSLFAAAVGELDNDRSRLIWLRMHELVVQDTPWMFLYHTRRLRLLQPGIEGYDNNSLQIRRYTRTRQKSP
jgi:peptide/nickel transport system substrate-binding protein